MGKEKFYGLTNDYMFHAVLQESEAALRYILSVLLDIPEADISECVIENPIIYGQAIDLKETILDVKLTLNNSARINIELQMDKRDYWPKRSMLYWSRTYDRLKKGEEYALLLPAVHIEILNFSLFPDEPEFYSEYRVKNVRTGRDYSDALRILVLDLTSRHLADNSEKEQRLLKLANIFKAESYDELEELCLDEEASREIAMAVRKLSEDERIRMQLEDAQFKKAWDSYERRQLYEDGKAEGLAEGKAEGESKMAGLIQSLMDAGRYDDIKKAVDDASFREGLYKELGIEKSQRK